VAARSQWSGSIVGTLHLPTAHEGIYNPAPSLCVLAKRPSLHSIRRYRIFQRRRHPSSIPGNHFAYNLSFPCIPSPMVGSKTVNLEGFDMIIFLSQFQLANLYKVWHVGVTGKSDPLFGCVRRRGLTSVADMSKRMLRFHRCDSCRHLLANYSDAITVGLPTSPHIEASLRSLNSRAACDHEGLKPPGLTFANRDENCACQSSAKEHISLLETHNHRSNTKKRGF